MNNSHYNFKNLAFLFSGALLPVFLAGGIYFHFRNNETVFVHVLQHTFSQEFLVSIQGSWSLYKNNFPSWFIYNLPGALWMFTILNLLSYPLSYQHFWKSKFNGLVILIFVGIEILQYFKITDGQFDYLDLVFYCFAILASFGYKVLSSFFQEINESSKTLNLYSLTVFCVFIGAIYLSDVY